MVPEQHGPLLSPLAPAAPLAGAAGVDRRVRAGAPEGVGAGVNRVLQEAQDGAVDGQAPLDVSAPVPGGLDDREGHVLLPTPQQHLPRAAQGREPLEDQGDGLVHPLIRILLHAVRGRADVADRRWVRGDGTLDASAAMRLAVKRFDLLGPGFAVDAQTLIERLEADANYFWVPTDRELEALGTALLKRRPGPAERAELRAAVFRPGSAPNDE